jgi:orotidine-5'-phosphate decarboxylase
MVQSAVEVLGNTKVTGVTILTSLSEADVSSIGFEKNALESAVGLAQVAVSGGARAIVCSPLEIVEIRRSIGLDIEIITPGVRPLDNQASDDQKRTMTPREAIDRGADLVVIGRPITSAWTQGSQAMRERAEQIASGIL